ncbi:DUF2244 domain-containing protein [Rhizobiaceae bacterium]|nr:DUF2244 domain-containing protein [Rhizobiaceae bacterium]
MAATLPIDGSGFEAPLFAARLTPYRSLSQRGFRILMSLVAAVCFGVGTMFWMMGFWPVMGFMGLDVLLVYLAFRASYASAKAYEDVAVSRDAVQLTQVSHKGRVANHAFPQYGTRFEVDRHDEIGITQMRLANRDRSVTFGMALNPDDRESFAEEFSRAMHSAKR